MDIPKTAYASRGGIKLELACSKLNVGFRECKVLDIGSSSGGFSDYALRNGATKIIAIELGTNQLTNKLREDKRIELHEKTDILNVLPHISKRSGLKLGFIPDIVLIDLSFVSLRSILPHVYKLVDRRSKLIVLAKPQFEAKPQDKHRGVIKNEAIRRRILKEFETWVHDYFVILNKIDSDVAGMKGNKERFYLLAKNISSK